MIMMAKTKTKTVIAERSQNTLLRHMTTMPAQTPQTRKQILFDSQNTMRSMWSTRSTRQPPLLLDQVFLDFKTKKDQQVNIFDVKTCQVCGVAFGSSNLFKHLCATGHHVSAAHLHRYNSHALEK
jgi:hypothetical protein